MGKCEKWDPISTQRDGRCGWIVCNRGDLGSARAIPVEMSPFGLQTVSFDNMGEIYWNFVSGLGKTLSVCSQSWRRINDDLERHARHRILGWNPKTMERGNRRDCGRTNEDQLCCLQDFSIHKVILVDPESRETPFALVAWGNLLYVSTNLNIKVTKT